MDPPLQKRRIRETMLMIQDILMKATISSFCKSMYLSRDSTCDFFRFLFKFFFFFATCIALGLDAGGYSSYVKIEELPQCD